MVGGVSAGQRGTGGWRSLLVSWGERRVPGRNGGAGVGVGETENSVADSRIIVVDGVVDGRVLTEPEGEGE